MELVGAAMGLARQDVFKQLKILQNVDDIVAQTQSMIDHYELDISEVREVIAKNIIGEQTLPLKTAD